MGSRRSHPIEAGVYSILCGGDLHDIRVTKKGRVTLLNHELSVQAAAKEFSFSSEDKMREIGCLWFAGFVTGQHEHTKATQLSSLSTSPSKVQAQRKEDKEQDLHESAAKKKLSEALRGSRWYRTTVRRHGVGLRQVMEGPPLIIAIASGAVIQVNLKRWARVALLGAALVEGHMVLDRVKIRSNKDMEVKYLRPGRGMKPTIATGNIRLGSDGVWRFS